MTKTDRLRQAIESHVSEVGQYDVATDAEKEYGRALLAVLDICDKGSKYRSYTGHPEYDDGYETALAGVHDEIRWAVSRELGVSDA